MGMGGSLNSVVGRQPPGDSDRGCMVMTKPTPLEKIFLFFLFQSVNVCGMVGDKKVTAFLPPKPWEATKEHPMTYRDSSL